MIGEKRACYRKIDSATNSMESLHSSQIPDAEFLIFEGGHGFGMATHAAVQAIIKRWGTNTED